MVAFWRLAAMVDYSVSDLQRVYGFELLELVSAILAGDLVAVSRRGMTFVNIWALVKWLEKR